MCAITRLGCSCWPVWSSASGWSDQASYPMKGHVTDLSKGSVEGSNTCHYPLKGCRQGKRVTVERVESILLGILTTLACRGKTKRTWLEFSGGNFGLYILLQCLYMCILDLWSKIRVTIATGLVKYGDKRGKCYRASSNMSHSESEIRVRHSHGMEARWKLRGLCIDRKKV